MALNWTMLRTDRAPVPLPNEMTVTTIETVVEVSLTIPDAPSAGALPSGCSGGVKKLKGYGKLYLTDQRVRRFPFLSRSNILKVTPVIDWNCSFSSYPIRRLWLLNLFLFHYMRSCQHDLNNLLSGPISYRSKLNLHLTEAWQRVQRSKSASRIGRCLSLSVYWKSLGKERSTWGERFWRRRRMVYVRIAFSSLARCHAQLHLSSIVYYAWWIKFRINGWWCPGR